MTESGNIPSLAQIQRTNLVLIAVVGLALLVLRSSAASLACVLGGAVVVVNLFILGLLGRALLAAAAGGASSALGAIAIPLKLLLIIGLLYLVFHQSRIDAIGFTFGVLTQMAAVLIETLRIRGRGQSLEGVQEG